MTDLAAIRDRHFPDDYSRERTGYVMCAICPQSWPCDADRLLTLLADTPSVEPAGLAEVQSALSWALGRIDKHPFTASELLDYEAAARLLPTQASDSPEKP